MFCIQWYLKSKFQLFKIRMILTAISVLVGFASATAGNCGEERSDACMERFLSLLTTNADESEICRELKASLDCLQRVVDDCLQDKHREDMKDSLEQLGELLEINCPYIKVKSESEDEILSKCFGNYQQHMHRCTSRVASEAITFLADMDSEFANEGGLPCTMYGMIADCFAKGLEQKCGKEIAEEAKKNKSYYPQSFQNACG